MQKYNQVSEYITEVCNQIRSSRAHQAVAKEINDHIEDQKDAFVLDGQDEETAISNAIKEMGDPIVVGEQLDKIHRPKPEKSIIFTVICLVLLQLLSVLLLRREIVEIGSYILAIFSGILIMWCIYFIDYSRIVRFSPYIYIALSLICFIISLNNNRIHLIRVSNYYEITYYFSLLMIVVYAMVIINYKNQGYKGYIICFLMLILGIGVNLLAGNVSSLIVFCIGSGILLLYACLRNVYKVNKKLMILGWLFLYGFMGAVVLINISMPWSYLHDRLMFIIYPYQYANSGGYTRVLIRETLSNTQFIGEAVLPIVIDNKMLYEVIPYIYTNYQLTYFISKFGYFVGIAVVFIIMFLILRMFMSTFKQKNQQGMFISLGCSIVILIQSVFYILANLGYEIVGTISLPLLSYGKASFIVNMLIIGIMLCTYRNDALVERK